MERNIAIPGDVVSDNIKMSGSGTYVHGDTVRASVYGLLNVGERYIS
ncbi:MAG TPA: RNA-binding protein, partial [Methanosarcinales archaeon]|nr:RNA-binding protein [Methanosarcinales archaeon]